MTNIPASSQTLLDFIQRKRKHYTPVKVVCLVRLSRIKQIEFIDNADMGQSAVVERVLQMARVKYGASFAFDVLEVRYSPVMEGEI